jgi:glycosyltransferase involved in cell wall biosynthesis
LDAQTADDPLRVLVTMPVAEQRGGSELQLQQLLEHRTEARLDPIVAFMRPGPMLDWCHERGVDATMVDGGRLRYPTHTARSVGALARLARRTEARLVVGWMCKGHVYGGPAAALARLPSAWLQPGLPSPRSPIDRTACLLPARVVITVSRHVDEVQRAFAPRRPTRVIYPAVDAERFNAGRIGERSAVRRRLGLPDSALIYGSVGRLDRWKGFHHLIDTLPAVLHRYENALLVLVGGPHELEPGYADELHTQVERQGLADRVLFAGRQGNPEEWMRAMDVFAHTSQGEPFGMVVIEAMAVGTPVIASAEAGPTEVITPGVDGLLSPYGDVEALAAGVIRLFGDPALRDELSQAGVRRAGDFDVKAFARTFGTAMAEAANAKRTGARAGYAAAEASR